MVLGLLPTAIITSLGASGFAIWSGAGLLSALAIYAITGVVILLGSVALAMMSVSRDQSAGEAQRQVLTASFDPTSRF